MMRRSVLATLLFLSVLAGFSSTAWAGGTATIELDKDPVEIEAGKPVTIGFMMLQHGVTPVEDGEPVMEAIHRETRDIIRSEGRPEGAVGHYVIEVTFPEAGEWAWSIAAYPFPQSTSFPALTVVAPGQLGQTAPPLSVAGIVIPRCGDAATPLFGLSAFTRLDGTAPDDSSEDGAILRSDSILKISFEDLLDTGAAISVMSSEGGALACGEILAEPVGGELIVGLSEVEGSGYVGIARITEENDQSLVEIYLAFGLTGASEPPPAANIEIEGATFGPATLQIPAGVTVTWINNDPETHEVAFTDISLDDSGPLHQSQIFSQRFDTPGTYEYICGPHPFMTGTIIVK